MPHVLGRLRGPPLDAFAAKLREDAPLHATDGLWLEGVWSDADAPDDILFLFRADDLGAARRAIERDHAAARRLDPRAALPTFVFLDDVPKAAPKAAAPAHVSLVTLGVGDIAAATRFYERLGWRRSSASNQHVTFFHAKGGGAVLALWGREALAEDARADARSALAANVPERADVDRALDAARQAGARVTKPAEDAFWGGRSGCFVDLDGHVWEVAWNPGFPLAADGSVRLP